VTQPSAGGEGHIGEFEMAAYLDRRLGTADRDRVEGHLAGCAECRQEMLQVRGLLGRSARPRRLLVGASLLAAAAALVLIVRPAVIGPVRGDGNPSALTAYGPTGDAALASLRFVWGAVPGVATYRLTVSAADGVPLWSGSVADTVMALPDSVVLQADQRYVWFADALLDDGSTRSTGLHEFRPVR
jgi:anti-sigma factor RsiW